MKNMLFYIFFVIVPLPAFAYLDLGSGSYFLQILLAFLFTISLSVRSFWHSIFSFFRRKRKEEDTDGEK